MLHLFEETTPKPLRLLPVTGKAALGQYMTPPNIAEFMVSLFTQGENKTLHLLDAGAGQGALTCAFLRAWRSGRFHFSQSEITLFERDSTMLIALEENTARIASGLPVHTRVYHSDFIEHAATMILQRQRLFTHAILNPPYKKISSQSQHRLILRDAGIETVNLYTAFVALTLALLMPGGQLVAIIPRSFCNGPYYRSFREFILRRAALRHIHLFTARNKAFKADNVLQENVIIRLERDASHSEVMVSTSTDDSLRDYSVSAYPFSAVVDPADREQFIHIPLEDTPSIIPGVVSPLASLKLEVSTGPVVDFRMKEYLHDMPEPGDVPLLYPGHFNGHTEWPRVKFKKPNAIRYCQETMKWMYPNGFYVVIRRLSSKEERRRIMANVVDPAHFTGMHFLGFENHLNVFHSRKQGLPENLARGLALYLNSSLVDAAFRRFNGHTQVNATDLRALRYPSLEALIILGQWARSHAEQEPFSQQDIDQRVENILQ